jgi:hypothetical protein
MRDEVRACADVGGDGGGADSGGADNRSAVGAGPRRFRRVSGRARRTESAESGAVPRPARALGHEELSFDRAPHTLNDRYIR